MYSVVDGFLMWVEELKTDDQFTEIFCIPTVTAETVDINILEEIPGQGRQRKVPGNFKYNSTIATADHQLQTLD